MTINDQPFISHLGRSDVLPWHLQNDLAHVILPDDDGSRKLVPLAEVIYKALKENIPDFGIQFHTRSPMIVRREAGPYCIYRLWGVMSYSP